MGVESGEGHGSIPRRVREWLLHPGVDEQRLQEALASATQRQPPPVIWLLGKAQSGKTSVIRALTGSTRAAIGNGFQACTRTANFYDFPTEAPVVRFLDTRGLGEVNYDESEDLAFCESQSHLVMAVMKVTDPDQEAVLRVLRAVRRRHPEWPVVVLQTALHEAYPDNRDHVEPWPFEQSQVPQAVCEDLRRLLAEQEQELHNLPGHAPLVRVPVDLTLPEDGFSTPWYGLDALWDAIDLTSAFELRSRLQHDPAIQDLFSRATHPHIMGYSLAAAGVGALPLVDAALLPALQVKLLHALGAIYQRPWNARTTSEFFGLLGAGVLAGYGLRWAGRSLVKLVPGWGQTLGAAWGASNAAAVTYALGKAADFYLSRTGCRLPVDAESLRQVYAEAYARGTDLHPGRDATA